MTRRSGMVLGMGGGVLWAGLVLYLGATLLNVPIYLFPWSLALSFVPPGLVMAAIVCVLATRRFLDDIAIDGGPLGGGAEIDRRVLVNTCEQLLLALALWPAAGHLLATEGAGVVLALGFGFAIARVIFWVGYHVSVPLQAFGFAATFFPTIGAILWAGLRWLV